MQFVNTLPKKELCPGYVSRLIHGEKSTLSFVDITKGHTLPEHSHPHEQVTYILEGELEMNIGGEIMLLKKGMAHVIPPNVPHSAKAHMDAKVIDFFSPARDDYR